MSKNSTKVGRQKRWNDLSEMLLKHVPEVASFLGDEEGFVELRIKARSDGTLLGIAKGYDEAGGPVVCFGSGYDASACLLSLSASIQGNNWRVDKPWAPESG